MEKINTEPSRLAWHPALKGVMELEVDELKDILVVSGETQVTTEPLKIDCIIIKKVKNAVLTKKIFAIFRDVNIIEYKSPDDYISVEDFYKVYAYTCLYIYLEKVSVTNLTISFINSRHPRELFAHLQEIRGYKVEEKSPGIYIINGDLFPIQVINNRKLPLEENFWLRSFDNRQSADDVNRFLNDKEKQEKAKRYGAFLDIYMRANIESFKEVHKMSGSTLTLEQFLEDIGLIAKWEARGKEEVALRMLQKGYSHEEISELSALSLEKIQELSESL
ncbi:MAG: hypothetical protein FWG77_09545 [Treponema sp.]|nr:hypothetical protein [Treponema sp.]